MKFTTPVAESAALTFYEMELDLLGYIAVYNCIAGGDVEMNDIDVIQPCAVV